QAVEEAGADPGGAERAVRVEVRAVARPADIGEERESRGGERCRDLGAAASEPLAALGERVVAAHAAGPADEPERLGRERSVGGAAGDFERADQRPEEREVDP